MAEIAVEHTNTDGFKKFTVVDYASIAFHYVRKLSNISERQHLQSIRSLQTGAEGEGKSGMMFFKTSDQQYVLKTLKTAELPVFLALLPQYVAHLDRFRCSLLPRFYGMTTFTFPGMGKYILIIMENVLRPKHLHSGWFSRQPRVHEVYDLKGSTKGRVVGRKASSSSSSSKGGKGGKGGKSDNELSTASSTCVRKKTDKKTNKESGPTVLKDLDCQRRLVMDPKRRTRFFTQLRDDVNFLISHNLMDYSLLLGVSFHDGSDAHRRASSDYGISSSSSKGDAKGSSGGCGGGSSGGGSGSGRSSGGSGSGSGSGSGRGGRSVEAFGSIGVPLQAVVNRVYGANARMDELLPTSDTRDVSKKYSLQCEVVGRYVVRERGISPYVTYQLNMTRVDTHIGTFSNTVETKKWTVYRRYTDFSTLRNKLNEELSVTGYRSVVPPLPPKVWLGNFDENVLDRRQQKLESWMIVLLQAFAAHARVSLSIKTFLTQNADEPPLGMSRRRSRGGKSSKSSSSGDGFAPPAAMKSMRVARATDVDSGYRVTLFLGVIDILQTFNLTKRVEASIKGRLSHPLAVSATDAQSYGKRFVDYLSTVLPPK